MERFSVKKITDLEGKEKREYMKVKINEIAMNSKNENIREV
jgi:hypothetical protein